MHKHLLAMRSSICGLKDELKKESERWEMELAQQEDRADLKPAPGYVTKVEVIRDNNHREELGINHAKQDSGILTDEERSDSDELEENVQQLLKTFPPAVKPRSSSLSATAKLSNSYHGHAAKRQSEEKESNKRKSPDVLRVRSRSVAGTDTERLSRASFSLSRRSQTFVDGMVSRFGSMPVINEIPSDALERNTARSKTFAVYGYRRSGSIDDNARPSSSSFSVPKNLPAFGSLTRHSSMPVMYSGGRPKSGIELRSKKENKRPVASSQPAIKRSTSQIILSRPALEKFKETKSNQMKPYRMYRSSSQVSLV